MDTKPTTFDEYLATVATGMRSPLKVLRIQLMALAPTATETISYAMPTLRYRDRVLVHYAAWKNHLALYGLDVDGHADLLEAYDTDKGTIRFPADELPPAELLATLINDRIAAIDAARDARKGRRQADVEPR